MTTCGGGDGNCEQKRFRSDTYPAGIIIHWMRPHDLSQGSPIRMVNASLNKPCVDHGGVKYKYMLNYHIKDMEWEKKKGLCNLFNSFWWWSHYIQCTSSNSSCLQRLSTCPGLAAATTGRVEYKQQLSWPGQVNSLSSCLGWLVSCGWS